MKKKSIRERCFKFLGIILGAGIWLVGVGLVLSRILHRTKQGDSAAPQDTRGSHTSQQDCAAVPGEEPRTQPVSVEPDMESGEDTVLPGFGDLNEELAHPQHGSLGGVPLPGDDDANENEESTAGGISPASDYSYPGIPYDADISDEGVLLTAPDLTDREGDVPLDEGIPNLGEPGDIEDTGPITLEEEASIDEVESGVPEEYGQHDEIDSLTNDQPWIADAPGEDREIPAASRGYREYGEDTVDEQDIEDAEDSDEFGIDDDVEPSGSGGEVDIENDEAPAWDESDLTIVDDPDESISADETDGDDKEETLGLRDSESLGEGGVEAAAETSDSADGAHLGVTGDFEDAEATERLLAFKTAEEDYSESGEELQSLFVTGEDGAADQGSAGTDRRDADDYGQTGEFGASAENNDDDSAPEETAGGQSSDSAAERREDNHLGVSGDFDKAHETQSIPAHPTPDDTSDKSDRADESFVTGDDVGESGNRDTDTSAAYSAAWSTPAGITGEWPNQDDPTGMQRESVDEDQQESDSVEAAFENGTVKDANSGSSDNAAGHASSAVGDLGTDSHGTYEEASSASAVPNAVAEDEVEELEQELEPERKSRKQRRPQSDRVPQGAIRGDGDPVCPADFPIKGNASSRIYHRPTDPSYPPTIPEYCFATEEDAKKAGFRAPKGH